MGHLRCAPMCNPHAGALPKSGFSGKIAAARSRLCAGLCHAAWPARSACIALCRRCKPSMRAHSDARVRDAHWASWLFGAALLLGLAAIVAWQRRGRSSWSSRCTRRRCGSGRRVAQLGTYVADARILQMACSARASRARCARTWDSASPSCSSTTPCRPAVSPARCPRARARSARRRAWREHGRGGRDSGQPLRRARVVAVGFALGVVWARGGPLRVSPAWPWCSRCSRWSSRPCCWREQRRADAPPGGRADSDRCAPASRALSAATPEIAHDARLIARSALLQLACSRSTHSRCGRCCARSASA